MSSTANAPSARAIKRMRIWMICAALVFASGVGSAMLLYPGGSVFFPTHPGFDFWFNNFCDLFAASGHNGLPNPGRLAALAGLAALVLGALPLWLTGPRALGGRTPWVRCVAFLGCLASIAAAAVPMRVHEHAFHGPAIFFLGVPFNLAVWITLFLSFRSARAPAWLKATGILLAASMLASFGSYFQQVALGHAPSVLLPVTQKTSSVFLVAWLYGLMRVWETGIAEKAK